MTRLARTSARTQKLRIAVLRGTVCAVGLWLALLPAPGAAWAGDWLAPVLAAEPEWGRGGTVHAAAGDGRGNAVALIGSPLGALGAISWPAEQAPAVPQQLSTGAVGGDVAMDAHGNAVAVWAQPAGVTSAFRPAGGTWLAPQDLFVATDGSVNGIRVAMSAGGLAVATWTRNGVVQAAVKPESSTAFGAVTDLAASAGEPDVAVSPGGDAVVVWARNPWPSEPAVQGAARPAGGSFELLGDLSAPGDLSRMPGRPRVAMDAQGRATAVWEAWHYGGVCNPELQDCPRHRFVDVQAAERGLTGDFGPAQTIATSIIHYTGAVVPQVVVEPDGTAVVAWIDGVDLSSFPTYVVRWSERRLGGSFISAREVFPESHGWTPVLSLAMAPDGTAMLLAHLSGPPAGDGAHIAVQSSVRPPGGSFAPPQDVERFSTNVAPPVLAFREAGDAVALWNDDGLRAARYDHNAPPPDPDLIFNGGFETNLAEWNTSSAAGISLTRETGGHSGEWAAKLANTGTTPTTCVLNDKPVFPLKIAEGIYTASLWVRATTPGQTLKLRLSVYDASTGALLGSPVTPVTLTTSWQRVSASYTRAAPGRSSVDLHAYVNNAPPGTCFFADDASLMHAPPPAQPPPDPGLVRNGWFESDLAGWNTSGSAAGVSLTREAGGHSGEWAAHLTNTTTTAGTCTLNDSPNTVATTAPGTYTASLWVRAPTAGQTLKLKLREYQKSTGSLLGSQTTPVILTTSWQHVTVAHTPSAPGTSTLDLNAYVSSAAPGTCFLADDASLVHNPLPAQPDPSLATNPGFETSLSGWNTSGSAAGVVLTREPSAHSGDWAAMVANTATTAGTCTLNDSPNTVPTTAPGTYTATLWVRAATAGQTLKLRLREYNGATLIGSQTTPIALTASWQRVSVTYTPAAPGTSTLDLNAYVSGAAPGTCFLADDATIQRT